LKFEPVSYLSKGLSQMNRRDFIKQSTLFASGLILSPFIPVSAQARTTDFSLTLIVPQPDIAVNRIQSALRGSALASGTISYSEVPLSGYHLADLVLIRNQRLINFKQQTDDLSCRLAEIYREFARDQVIENPILIRLVSGAFTTTPQHVYIYRGNEQLVRHPLHQDTEMELEGLKGNVVVHIQNGKVRIVAAECRHQTCQKMGAIHQAGQHLVCIPNQIQVSLDGISPYGVDSVAG